MRYVFLVALFVTWYALHGQQIADTSYSPVILDPVYNTGRGPVVYIDEAHHNFHTKDGRYQAFAKLLERDGYQVQANAVNFTEKSLSQCNILVISNALNERNVEDWFLPTPSAFTTLEIQAVRSWVASGGSLFLIADHMPMAGAAHDLAAVFGFEFTNGFVFDTTSQGPIIFSVEDRTLHESIVTGGRNVHETVDHVATFTGQGFNIPEDATPVLTFGGHCINALPDTAWVFDNSTVRMPATGFSQGAYKRYGNGRVAAFGEAAMFTAQLAGPNGVKTGMNQEIANQNFQFLLNLIHWLDGVLDE